jgi:WD40 repeat protein
LPEPPLTANAGKDSEGSPLPAGAKARLGQTRFQHRGPVVALRYTPDGKSILAQTRSLEDAFLWIHLARWDADTGKMLQQIYVSSVSHRPGLGGGRYESWRVSQDTKHLARGDRLSRAFYVQEISTGKIVFHRIDPKDHIGLPDSASNFKTLIRLQPLTLIDLATGRERKLDPVPGDGAPTGAYLSPNEKYLLVVNENGTLNWWDLDRGGAGVPLSYTVNRFSFTRPVFTPDSRYFAVVTARGEKTPSRLLLLESASGKVALDLGQYDELPERILFSPDSKQMITVVHKYEADWKMRNGEKVPIPSYRVVLQRWEVATGKELPPIESVECLYVEFSPDACTLGVATSSSLQLHDATSGQVTHRIPLEANSSVFPAPLYSTHQLNIKHGVDGPFAFSPDGKRVAVAARRTIRQFDLATGKEIGPTPYTQTVLALSVAKNSRWVASWSPERVQVWDARANQVVLEIKPWLSADKQDVSLTAAVLTADGRHLAVGGSDGTIALFDVPSARRLCWLRFHRGPVTSLVFLAEGKTLVSADLHAQVAFWDLASGDLLRNLEMAESDKKDRRWWFSEGHNSWHTLHNSEGSYEYWEDRPVLVPDGRGLIWPGKDVLRLYEFGKQSPGTIASPHRNFGKIVPSPDGRWLAMTQQVPGDAKGNDALVIRLLDARTGKELRALANFTPITDCGFSPDGRWLAACGTRGIRLWDTATGTPQGTFNAHRGAVTAIAFSADGSSLVSAGYEGTLVLWDLATLLHRPKSVPLTAADLSTLWDQLASPDAEDADRAIRRLLSHPHQATALLREQLKPVPPVSKEAIARLVADLDDSKIKVRTSATKELERLAELAEPALRACLAGTPTLEQRQRVEKLLTRLHEPLGPGDKLRALRAVEVLDVLGTPEAIEVLRILAGGAEQAHVTREARSALRRRGLQARN